MNTEKVKKRALWIMIGIVLLNSIGMTIVFPLLPFLLGEYLPDSQIYIIIASVTIITLGEGLFEPSLNGSLSKSVGDHEQGKLQGVNQSLQSLYRVLVPLGAAAVYLYSPGILYLLAMFIALGALLLFTRLKTASAIS